MLPWVWVVGQDDSQVVGLSEGSKKTLERWAEA